MAQRCHQKMQLAFAANMYVGRFPHEVEPTEQSESSVDTFNRTERAVNGPRGLRAQRLGAQQEEEDRRRRDRRPPKDSKKRESKRENKRENKRDRKKDRKHDRKHYHKRGRE